MKKSAAKKQQCVIADCGIQVRAQNSARQI
jgi:hypothetical protein